MIKNGRQPASLPLSAILALALLPVCDSLPGGAPYENAGQAIAASPAIASAPSVVEFFRAYEVTAGVELAWMAVSDKDIEGFKVYRGESSVPAYRLINGDGLIRAWEHDYVDGTCRRGRTYRYVLGVVHADGSEQLSQPAEITTSSRSID